MLKFKKLLVLVSFFDIFLGENTVSKYAKKSSFRRLERSKKEIEGNTDFDAQISD